MENKKDKKFHIGDKIKIEGKNYIVQEKDYPCCCGCAFHSEGCEAPFFCGDLLDNPYVIFKEQKD